MQVSSSVMTKLLTASFLSLEKQELTTISKIEQEPSTNKSKFNAIIRFVKRVFQRWKKRVTMQQAWCIQIRSKIFQPMSKICLVITKKKSIQIMRLPVKSINLSIMTRIINKSWISIIQTLCKCKVFLNRTWMANSRIYLETWWVQDRFKVKIKWILTTCNQSSLSITNTISSKYQIHRLIQSYFKVFSPFNKLC